MKPKASAVPASIGAGEFKARCLELMDHVSATGEPLVITKRGKPVARLVQVDTKRPSLFGCMRGEIEVLGDIISPITPDEDPGDLSLFDLTPEPARRKGPGRAKRQPREKAPGAADATPSKRRVR